MATKLRAVSCNVVRKNNPTCACKKNPVGETVKRAAKRAAAKAGSATKRAAARVGQGAKSVAKRAAVKVGAASKRVAKRVAKKTAGVARGAAAGMAKGWRENPTSKAPKIKAVSFQRYNGGVRVKRQWGSSTVTSFYVGLESEFGKPSFLPDVVEGFGKTPGERKTYAVNKWKRDHGMVSANPTRRGAKRNPARGATKSAAKKCIVATKKPCPCAKKNPAAWGLGSFPGAPLHVGKWYSQTFQNGDKIYFLATDTYSKGWKGLLVRAYVGKKPQKAKSDTVLFASVGLWKFEEDVPKNVWDRVGVDAMGPRGNPTVSVMKFRPARRNPAQKYHEDYDKYEEWGGDDDEQESEDVVETKDKKNEPFFKALRAKHAKEYAAHKARRGNPTKAPAPKMTAVPKGQIEYIVRNYHVGTPDSEVRANIEDRARRAGASDKIVKACGDYAVKCHRVNQKMYGDVMSGNIGSGKRRRNPAQVATAARPGVASITVTRLEGGNHDLNVPHKITIEPWKNANDLLATWCAEAGTAKNKCKFVVKYSDGESYSGTFYVSKALKRPDLRKHIQKTIEAAVGKRRPSHMTPEQYKQHLAKVPAGTKRKWMTFLRKYA